MSSPPPPPKSSPTAAQTTNKKPQPIPWTHQETVYLIQSYKEKWYSLKRGPVKSSQWEEVAASVASRCGKQRSKSGIQCRHKMEKLRKRYREERVVRGSSWEYLGVMDGMERGPVSSNNVVVSSNNVVRDNKNGYGSSNYMVNEGLVVKEVRALAEQMMMMESRKMEMVKEMERWRMEMENKQLEMILSSHTKLIHIIAHTFASSHGDH